MNNKNQKEEKEENNKQSMIEIENPNQKVEETKMNSDQIKRELFINKVKTIIPSYDLSRISADEFLKYINFGTALGLLRTFIHVYRKRQKQLTSKTSTKEMFDQCSRPAQFEQLFKKPDEWKGQWIGVEIECLIPNSNVQMVLDSKKAWRQIGYDSSVQGDMGYKGLEVRLLLREGQWDKVVSTCKILAEAKAMVNITCGLHVHLDMRDINRQVTMKDRLVTTLSFLTLMVSPSRLNNRYCQDNRTTRARSRYMMINTRSFNEHGTFEVRLHQGSIDAEKIINWIKLLFFISNTHTRFTSLKKILTNKKVPVELKEYIKSRVSKFNPQALAEALA